MIKSAVTGSFDPITKGHLNIIKRASKLFDSVDVVVLVNPEKTPFFSLEERLMLIREAIKGLSNVQAASYDGMTVDYCKMQDIKYIVRGVRGKSDIDYEVEMANFNRDNGGIETILLPADDELTGISSSLLKKRKDRATEVLPTNIVDLYNKILGDKQ